MAHKIDIIDKTARLTLSGDIDLQISGDIKSDIERLRDVDRLEIDASDVSYIDSSGVAVLILARQFCAQNNMTLALPSISAAVHRVLQIARLDVMLPIGGIASPASGENAPDEGADSFDADMLEGGAFGSDDDLVNSLLSDDDPATSPDEEEVTAIGDDLAGNNSISDNSTSDGLAGNDNAGDFAGDFAGLDSAGDFAGLDIDAVDFSEPAKATPSLDTADEDADLLSDGDALKPGTFS